jgi:uncharacterized protein (DUF433 family)
MTGAVEIGSPIDHDPAIRAGRPKIAGTGVTVMGCSNIHEALRSFL